MSHDKYLSCKLNFAFFCRAACSERDKVVTHFCSVCMRPYVCACIVYPSGFVRVITLSFLHGFQNDMAQVFSLMGYWTVYQHALKSLEITGINIS